MFHSIWYPSLPYFPTPYLRNQDFGDPDRALQYIMKHFKLEAIHDSSLTLIKTLSIPIPSSTQITSYFSNVISINQFKNAMPIFKNGQSFMPDIPDLMTLILYSSFVSYCQYSLFLPHHEHLFKKVEHRDPRPNGVLGQQCPQHSIFFCPPQYHGQSQNSPGNTK